MARKVIKHRGSYQLIALATGEAQLLIYGAIGKGWWSETGIEAIEVIHALETLGDGDLTVRIASDGGSVTEGIAIASALRRYPGRVTTIVDSVAASIASVIFCAGAVRIMPSNAMVMLHGVIGDGGIGNAEQIRENADAVERMSTVLVESYIAAVSEDQRPAIEAMLLDGKDHWLKADEALALGICTQVDEPLAMAAVRRVDLSRFTSLPAAAAAFNLKKEPAMNFKLLALALGLSVAANAQEADLRTSVLTHLKLADTATDADIEAAIATARAAAPTPANPVAVVTATPAARVAAMFTAALHGQATNQALLTLQRNTNVAVASGGEVDVDQVRTQILAAIQAPASSIAGRYVPVEAGDDERDKRREAGVAWLLQRAAVYTRGSAEARALAASMGANPYRGMSFADLARACLEDAGFNCRRMNRHDVIANAITQSTSDFPNIFENALHKTLLIGFTVAPTTWDRICRIGSLSDFRPHIRYRGGSIGDLDVVQPNGEFKTLTLGDAERESLQAKSRGGILNVSREMLVNDDMGVFSDLALDLGKSASRTREKAFYVLLALNAGMGPNMGDGKALFHADHGNISADPGVPTVIRIDNDRQQMSKQKDPSGNDFVDVRPDIWLGPLSLGGTVRVINGDKYDPDAANKLQRTNISYATYSDVIDTPRLNGAPWYSFANPNIEPVFEMGFVDGQQSPQLATEEAFNQHGMKWRIVDEWGLGAVGWRGANRNAGA